MVVRGGGGCGGTVFGGAAVRARVGASVRGSGAVFSVSTAQNARPLSGSAYPARGRRHPRPPTWEVGRCRRKRRHLRSDGTETLQGRLCPCERSERTSECQGANFFLFSVKGHTIQPKEGISAE